MKLRQYVTHKITTFHDPADEWASVEANPVSEYFLHFYVLGMVSGTTISLRLEWVVTLYVELGERIRLPLS
ncbi:MAG TPA: hypothetical protein EYO33_30990 [Phycisphaerales bacterium]|nr:hypothetical protein [Phycisphaerales bacterium]